MTDLPERTNEDPWLTLAEIAEELRLSPVTIRSWVSKGRLRAMRAGQRKWLVRRSDLEAMLADDLPSRPAPPTHAADEEPYPDEILRRMSLAAAEDERTERERALAVARYEWEIALGQSRMAPPDARFVSRIRHIALAAEHQAGAILDAAAEPGFPWTPIEGSEDMVLSYELRPGGNRPGPSDAWDRVDRVVARLGQALAGTNAGSVATVLGDLARALRDVADAIDRPAGRSDGSPDGSRADR